MYNISRGLVDKPEDPRAPRLLEQRSVCYLNANILVDYQYTRALTQLQ